MTVYRIPVGGDVGDGSTSAYVNPDRCMVVDPGPPTYEAWNALLNGFSNVGLAVSDIEYVLVTHWHIDHAGNAPRLADAANARLFLHEADAPLVADYAAERARRLERDARRLRGWGVPTAVVERVTESDRRSPVPDRTSISTLSDGDSVAGVTALHTPGHTLGHLAFAVDDVCLVGDLVLGEITPNLGGDTRLEEPLRDYCSSLDRIAAYDIGYPGHGTPLDLETRSAEIKAHHERRSGRVLEAVTATEAATPWAVACDLFGSLDGVHVKFGVAEAAAHLRALTNHEFDGGELVRVDRDPARYEWRRR
ncbi:MBL fold metallo-hydrolase [Haloferacaceae archaeon DSL9]